MGECRDRAPRAVNVGAYYFYIGRRWHWRNALVVWFWWSRARSLAPEPREIIGPAYRFPRRFGRVGSAWDRDADLYVLRPLVPLLKVAWWWRRWRWVLEHALMYAGVLTYPRMGEYAEARIPELLPESGRGKHRLVDWHRREMRALDGSWAMPLPPDFSWWDGMRGFFQRWP